MPMYHATGDSSGEGRKAALAELSQDERVQLLAALRAPRGRYSAIRAAQLAGVPQRTLYDWAKTDVLVPDYNDQRPKRWSYRDLVFARMTAWLRTKSMSRSDVITRVNDTRAAVLAGDDAITVRGTEFGIFIEDEHVDRRTGQTAFEEAAQWVDTFDLVVPAEVKELGVNRLWGPHLVHPTPRATISPWIMGGDPCVAHTRIPTSSLFALNEERNLDAFDIMDLYPELEHEDVEEALTLERRLRRLEEPSPV